MKYAMEAVITGARKAKRQRDNWKRKAEALARIWEAALASLDGDGMPFDRVAFKVACNEARHELWGPP
jgi:hypothetical protein